jgi:hypothetical protein
MGTASKRVEDNAGHSGAVHVARQPYDKCMIVNWQGKNYTRRNGNT